MSAIDLRYCDVCKQAEYHVYKCPARGVENNAITTTRTYVAADALLSDQAIDRIAAKALMEYGYSTDRDRHCRALIRDGLRAAIDALNQDEGPVVTSKAARLMPQTDPPCEEK